VGVDGRHAKNIAGCLQVSPAPGGGEINFASPGRLFTPAGEIPAIYFAGEIGEIGDISPRTLTVCTSHALLPLGLFIRSGQ
jgi:hypothetical protein